METLARSDCRPAPCREENRTQMLLGKQNHKGPEKGDHETERQTRKEKDVRSNMKSF